MQLPEDRGEDGLKCEAIQDEVKAMKLDHYDSKASEGEVIDRLENPILRSFDIHLEKEIA